MSVKNKPTAVNRLQKFNVFVSHCIDDKKFVFEVCDLLSPFIPRERIFLFEKRPSLEGPFLQKIDSALENSELVLIFVGKRFDDYMIYESMRTATAMLKSKRVIIVDIKGNHDPGKLPDAIRKELSGRFFIPDNFTDRIPQDTIRCAKEIVENLAASQIPAFSGLKWTDKYIRWGLPASPIFDYEKDIIRFYIAKQCKEMLDQGVPTKEEQSLFERFRSLLSEWPLSEIEKILEKGVPAIWPKVFKYKAEKSNPLLLKSFRGDSNGESFVNSAALLGLSAPGQILTLQEAGPREKVCFPTHGQIKAAIVVVGGIAPGINAVIDAIVQRHYTYYHDSHQKNKPSYHLEVIGLKNGFLAIKPDSDFAHHSQQLTPSVTVENATLGGSMIGTSRDDELLKLDSRGKRLQFIARELKRQQIDVLYIIAGDGGMKAAHALWHKVNATEDDEPYPTKRMSVVSIPKTMDNDILWVWQSFGFLSAVEEAREFVERIHMEVRSNPRLGIVQFFGSGSGFVVSHAVLAAATGHTTLALIPEVDFSVIGVACYLKRHMWESADPHNKGQAEPEVPIDQSIPHGLIVMAETAIPLDALECLGLRSPPISLKSYYDAIVKKIDASTDEKKALLDFFEHGRRVQGQTDENLRNLGVKILRESLPILIQDNHLNSLIADPPGFDEPDWSKLRMVRIEPRYLIRALEPSTSDIITGQRLGLLAVDAAMAGFTDCMISQWLTEFTIVPLDLVVLGRKRIPPSGMFWNSVTAKTRQPGDLVAPYQTE